MENDPYSRVKVAKELNEKYKKKLIEILDLLCEEENEARRRLIRLRHKRALKRVQNATFIKPAPSKGVSAKGELVVEVPFFYDSKDFSQPEFVDAINSVRDYPSFAEAKPWTKMENNALAKSIRFKTARKMDLSMSLVDWNAAIRSERRLNNRSPFECKIRWQVHENPTLVKTPWTQKEDDLIRKYIDHPETGSNNWLEISKRVGTRTPFACLARYQSKLNGKIVNSSWTPEEDQILKNAVKMFGSSQWQCVADCLDGRVATQCSQRWNFVLSPGIRNGGWSIIEDRRLVLATFAYSKENSPLTKWNVIEEYIPHRTQAQCRERWVNVISPNVSTERFSKEEDLKLKELVEKHGFGKWSVIAKEMGRTDCRVLRRCKVKFKNEWKKFEEKKQLKKIKGKETLSLFQNKASGKRIKKTPLV